MPTTFTSAALHQFDSRVREILAERGVTATHESISRILGIPTSTYGNCLSGRQRLSLEVLVDWLAAWNAQWPKLSLYVNHTGVLVVREERLAESLDYEGDDLLGHLGTRVYPTIIMTADGPKRVQDLPVYLDAIEWVGGEWRACGSVGVARSEVEAWAYFTPHRQAPGARSAIKLYMKSGQELAIVFTDGPALMRLLHLRGVRRPDVPLPL